MAKPDKKNLKEYIKQISEISDWFENQEEIDVEEALIKVKEAAELIKASKERLVEVENEFKEIKREISGEE
ncbi:MAG TPA: hypothetical protein VJL32_01920 [Candidatus Paceibacterota bacterium]